MASSTGQSLSQKALNGLLHMAALDTESLPSNTRMTGIICTIGPKTSSVEKLVELIKAGMNVVRLNFSHGSYEFHGQIVANAKEAARQVPGCNLAIALDTKGPEIRLGQLKNDEEIVLEKGNEIIMTTDPARKTDGDLNTIFVDYQNLPKVVPIGGLIYVDDGLISLEVLEKTDVFVRTRILNTGRLGSRKGVNLPNSNVDLPAVSEKDRKDLQWGVEQGVDMVFASFIRKPADVLDVREALGPNGKNVKIISKIENQEGVRNFDEILKVTDGVMVARGDLGIEIPPEKVFLAQKMMIARCNIAGKAVICATHMLESMTYNPRPTRAEVSDVANAVLDGSDCVMLSGETAKGNYPVEAVTTMHRVCREAENAIFYNTSYRELRQATPKPLNSEEATASAAVGAAFESNVAAIIVLTTTGHSAHLVSKYRPHCPILTVTRDPMVARLCHLYRGLIPIHYDQPRSPVWQEDVDARIKFATDVAKKRGIAKSGDTLVAIQGWRGGIGNTNTVRLLNVE